MVLGNAGFAQYDPKALEILDAMSKKYKEMSGFKAKFSFTLESPSSNINETSEGEITVKGAKFRLKIGGQEIYNNGTTVWTYVKENNEVNISDYDPADDEMNPAKIYSMYKKGYKYMLVEEKIEEGKTYQIIDLVPEDKNQQYFKIRLQINKTDYTLKSWKVFEKNGNRYLYSVKSFEPNLKLEDGSFNFDKSKYPKVEVIDLR